MTLAKEGLQFNGWLPIAWAEYIGEHAGNPQSSTVDASFGYEGGNQAVFSIVVNFVDVNVAISSILGVNQYNPQTGNLDRTLPVLHPYFDWLRADRITSVRPIQWTGKFNNLVAGGGGATLTTGGVNNLPSSLTVTGGYGLPSYSSYKYFLIQILFTQPKWVMLSDSDLDNFYPPVTNTAGNTVRQEWKRFVTVVPQPSSEVLTRNKGAFTFADGPAKGTSFPSSQAQFLSKPDYVVTWHRVPLQPGVMSSLYNAPFNLTSCLNCVNNNAILFGNYDQNNNIQGFAEGTLMLKGFRIINKETPYSPEVIGLSSAKGQPSLCCDVEMVFSYFDPPTANPSNPTYRGHNLAPRDEDNLWYLVTVDGNPASSSIYQTNDLTNCFLLNE